MFQTEVVEKIKTRILCSNFFFFENCAVYEIMWKNVVQPYRPQMTIWSMRIACWIPKATNRHSEYVILIVSPLQQWLHERASVLRCTYIVCLAVKEICVWNRLIWSAVNGLNATAVETFLSLSRIEPIFIGRPVCNLSTKPTDLLLLWHM